LQLQSIEVWFDPMEMFRQITPNGVVSKVKHEKIPGQDLTGEETTDEDELEETHVEMSKITPAECPFMNHE